MSATITNNTDQLSQATVNFIKTYNRTDFTMTEIAKERQQAFQAIGLANIEREVTVLIGTSTFITPNKKQDLKISAQRWTATLWKGHALVISGNNITLHTLLADETTNNKGKVIKIVSDEDKAKAKADADKEKARQDEFLATAEQNQIRAEKEEAARKSAESTVSHLTKSLSDAQTELKGINKKHEEKQVDLEAQLKRLQEENARLKHEASATVSQYMKLADAVRDPANTRKQLLSMVG